MIVHGFAPRNPKNIFSIKNAIFDSKMNRTAERPLPSGSVGPEAALLMGGAFSVIGLLILSAWVNLLVAVLGAITLVTYIFVYTPLKRKSEWNTIIGAIPGALPPLMGWAAARGEVDPFGWTLFGILFLSNISFLTLLFDARIILFSIVEIYLVYFYY